MCYVDAFSTSDLEFIVEKMYPKIPTSLIKKMVEFNQKVAFDAQRPDGTFARRGGPWELNLRDIFRWCDLIVERYHDCESDIECGSFVESIYSNRFRSEQDKHRVAELYEAVFRQPMPQTAKQLRVTPHSIQIGECSIARSACELEEGNFEMLHSQLTALKSLMTCINMKWLAIIVGPTGVGKSSLVQLLARLAGKQLKSLTVSSEMDTIELLGSFEKKDLNRHYVQLETAVLKELQRQSSEYACKLLFPLSRQLCKRWFEHRRLCLSTIRDEVERIRTALSSLRDVAEAVEKPELINAIEQLIEKVSKCKSLSGGGNFEWIDSQLVSAIKNGDWLLIDDVNLCSSSVLDRLNGLLEPRGTLVMTEQGVVGDAIPVITPHEDFRLIMTMDPRNGELSRAMRNRALEIYMLPADGERDLDVVLQSNGVDNAKARKVFVSLHKALRTRNDFAALDLNAGHLVQTAKCFVSGYLRSNDMDANISRAVIDVYQRIALDDRSACVLRGLLDETLRHVTHCESTRVNRIDVRQSIGNSIMTNVTNQLIVLNPVDRVDGHAKAIAHKIYIELSSHDDARLRCRLSPFNGGPVHELVDVTVTKLKEILADAYHHNYLSAMPIDFRFNRQVWQQFWIRNAARLADKLHCVERCLNRYLMNVYWQLLKQISAPNDEQPNSYQLSARFQSKSLTAKQLPASFVRHTKELVDEIESQLVENVLKIAPKDDDFFTLQEMLSWIGELFRFCYSRDSGQRSAHLVEQFVVRWTLTNQFAIERLRSYFEIDLSKLIKKVNESVNIDVIEHKKGWNKLATSLLSTVRLCYDAKSADLWNKLYELISLWLTMPEKLLNDAVRDQMYELVEMLIGDRNEHDIENRLATIEKHIRDVSTPKDEDEQENDVELLTTIKRRCLLTQYELLPLCQFVFNLQEKRLLSAQANYVAQRKPALSLINPIHQALLARSDDVKCDHLLYHFIDNNQNMRGDKLIAHLNKQSAANDRTRDESLWLAANTEVSPQFSFVVTSLLNSVLFSLGSLSAKKSQTATLHNFLWHNFGALSADAALDVTAHHARVIKKWIDDVASKLDPSQADHRYVDALLNKATRCLSSERRLLLGVAEAFAGLASAKLLAPVNTIDPVQRKACKLSHCRDRLKLIETELELRDALAVFETGEQLHAAVEHPHIAKLFEIKHQLQLKIDKMSQLKCHRPTPSQYLKLRNEIKQFLSIQLDTNTMESLLAAALDDKAVSEQRILQQLDRMIASVTNFTHHLMTYTLYYDQTSGFITSLLMLKHGLEIVAAELRAQSYHAARGFMPTVAAVCTHSLAFPNVDPFALARHMDNANYRHDLASCLSECAGKGANLSLILRSVLIDLQNGLLLSDRNKREAVRIFCNVLNLFVAAWKESEQEKARQKEAEDALFEYRTRTLGAELTSADQDARDIAENFPSFREAFSDLLNETLMADDEPAETIERNLPVTDDSTLDIISMHEAMINALSSDASASTEIDLHRARELRYSTVAELLEQYGPPLLSVTGFDEARLVAAHLMRCATLNRPPAERTASFNIYQDQEPDELRECYAVFSRIEQRIVTQLLIEHPGHPTLTKLLRLIDRVFGFSVHSPLIKFVTGAELLLEAAQEWQKIAHRGIALTDELAELTALVIKWRKLEMAHWSACLDSVQEKIEQRQRSKYWFHFYDLLAQLLASGEQPASDAEPAAEPADANQVQRENIKTFVRSLKTFMESAKLGEYSARLYILHNFARHVAVTHGVDCELYFALENVHRFYKQFQLGICDRVRQVRAPIEKELKEFLKIQTYRDVNYFSVKAAIDKTHKTLHRHMKKFDEALSQPINSLLHISLGAGEIAARAELTISPSAFLVSETHCASTVPFIDATLSSAKNFANKMKLLSKKTMSACGNLESGVNDLDEMTGDIIANIKHLQALQVPADVTDKKKWKEIAHHIHNRKRKALNDLFKQLADNGLKFRAGIVAAADYDIDRVLLECGPLSVDHDHDVNKYFNSCLARYAALSDAIQAPSHELTMSSIERIKGFSGHLLKSIVEHRKQLAKHISAADRLKSRFDHVFTGGELVREQAAAIDCIDATSSLTERAVLLLSEINEFAKCAPEPTDEEVLMFTENDTAVNCEPLVALSRTFCAPLRQCLVTLRAKALVFEDDIEQCRATFELLSQLEASSEAIALEKSPIQAALGELCEEISRKKSQFDEFNAARRASHSATSEPFEESNHVVAFTMKSIELLFKRFTETSSSSKVYTLTSIVQFGEVWSTLGVTKCIKRIDDLCDALRVACAAGHTRAASDLLRISRPFVEQYIKLSDYFSTLAVVALRVNSKLLHVLLGVFTELATNGFCLPPELQDEQTEQQKTDEKFRDISDAGLGEGDGAKDVSKNIESEDQLEDTLKRADDEKQRDESDNKDVKGEDNAVEMSDDFDANAYDPDSGQEEEKEDSDGDDDDDKDQLDDQMGDLDRQDETYDKQIWDDDNEDADELSDNENDDGRGESIGDDKMVANEENAGLNDKDDPSRDTQQKQPDDEFDEVKEQKQNDEYDGEHEDPYKSKQAERKDTDDQPVEFPENMQLDADEEAADDDEKGDAESDTSPDAEPETKPDEPGGDDVQDIEPEEAANKEAERDTDKKDANEPDEGDDSGGQETDEPKQTEETADKQGELESEQGLTEDATNATREEEALPAAIDFAARNDNVQSVPEEQRERDQSHSDMQSCEKEEHGVGEAQVGQNTEGHEGVAKAKSSVEHEREREQLHPQDFKRKIDRTSLAKEERKSAKRHKVLESDDAARDTKPQEKEPGNKSSLYQHIDEDMPADDEVIDTAAEEDALKSRPNRENESGDEMDEDVKVEPDEMDTSSPTDEVNKSLESMKLKNDSTSDKKSKTNADASDDAAEKPLEIDGEFVSTAGAQRAPETTYHTKTDAVEPRVADRDWILKLQPLHRSDLAGKVPFEEAALAWEECTRVVHPLVYELCEQLQLVLEPTKSARLKGDYRTGKRINMRKVVAYIASQFRKDKIWMKRNKPSKRTYQIILAVDDSMSMADNQSKKLAFESLALLSKSLTLLEAGELAVMSFGEQVKLLHTFSEPFTEAAGAKLLTDVSDADKCSLALGTT